MATLKELLFIDKSDWIGPKITQYLFANPTVFITLIYILISGLGLLYEIILFSEFKINVLDYSEVADFFLAAFKRPDAFMAGSGLVISLVIYRTMANYARNHKKLYIKIPILLVSFIGLLRREILIPIGIIYFIFFFGFAAQEEANKLVHKSDALAIISTRYGEIKNYKTIPIGATEKFFFGIEMTKELREMRKSKKGIVKPDVKAIPFTNIISIAYSPVEFNRVDLLYK